MDSIIFLFQVYMHFLCDMLDLKWIIADEMTAGENLTDLSVTKLIVLLWYMHKICVTTVLLQWKM